MRREAHGDEALDMHTMLRSQHAGSGKKKKKNHDVPQRLATPPRSSSFFSYPIFTGDETLIFTMKIFLGKERI